MQAVGLTASVGGRAVQTSTAWASDETQPSTCALSLAAQPLVLHFYIDSERRLAADFSAAAPERFLTGDHGNNAEAGSRIDELASAFIGCSGASTLT